MTVSNPHVFDFLYLVLLGSSAEAELCSMRHNDSVAHAEGPELHFNVLAFQQQVNSRRLLESISEYLT